MKKGSGKGRSKWNRFLYNDNVVGYVFSAPFVIGFLGFTIIPMIVSMYCLLYTSKGRVAGCGGCRGRGT